MLYSKIEGTGTPLVIIHGFLGMSDNWKTLGARYAENGFEVHMLDLRNHGRSFHSDVFTYDAMAQDVLEYLDARHIAKADLIGHSMGGKVSMLFAVNHPDRVRKLIVADIGPRYYRPHHQDILAGLAAVDFSIVSQRSDVEDILKPYIPDGGTRQFLMKSLYWKEPGKLAWRFNLDAFVNNQQIIGESLAPDAVYNQPTLFIRGGNSDYIRETDYESIRVQFPQAEFETIHRAGHWLHAENPDDFLLKTLMFLQKN